MRSLARMGVPWAWREDVVQETLLKASLKFPGDLIQKELPERLGSWLVIAARRLAIDRLRHHKRHPVQSLDALRVDPEDREEGNADLAWSKEEVALLYAWMEELRQNEPDSYRLLHGHYFDDLAVKDLAALMGLSPRAASKRLVRLRNRLHASMLRHFDAADAPNSCGRGAEEK